MTTTDDAEKAAVQLRVVATEVERIMANMKALIVLCPSIDSSETQALILVLEKKLAATREVLAAAAASAAAAEAAASAGVDR